MNKPHIMKIWWITGICSFITHIFYSTREFCDHSNCCISKSTNKGLKWMYLHSVCTVTGRRHVADTALLFAHPCIWICWGQKSRVTKNAAIKTQISHISINVYINKVNKLQLHFLVVTQVLAASNVSYRTVLRGTLKLIASQFLVSYVTKHDCRK